MLGTGSLRRRRWWEEGGPIPLYEDRGGDAICLGFGVERGAEGWMMAWRVGLGAVGCRLCVRLGREGYQAQCKGLVWQVVHKGVCKRILDAWEADLYPSDKGWRVSAGSGKA